MFGELCQLNTAQIAAIQGDRQVLDQLPQFDHRRVILEELDRGSAGVVYQALDHLLDRVVAIKQVHPERTTADGMSLLRFEREAKIMASLEHPAIVTLHDVGLTKEGCPFMVLAYVPGPTLLEIIQHAREGHDLEEVLERGRLSQERVAR